MDDKDDKKSSGSAMSALLERIPILDGGGRRRLTAGTIVVLTAVLVIDGLRTSISTMIITKDLSLSLFLAAAGLLIYATGVIVELVGEVFLARAVSNIIWSFVDASSHVKTWRRGYKPIGWLYIAILGTIRAVVYFISGLFGASKWQMRPMWRLSKNARHNFESQPPSVRDSIQCALGNNAEFGRKALIDQLQTPESRRWARRLMDRPKDVLALVSAIIISLSLYLALTPILYTISSDVKAEIAAQQMVIKEASDQIAAEIQMDSKEITDIRKRTTTETGELQVQDPVIQNREIFLSLMKDLQWLGYLMDLNKLANWDGPRSFDLYSPVTSYDMSLRSYSNILAEDFANACNRADQYEDMKIAKNDSADLKALRKIIVPVCKFRPFEATRTIQDAYQQIQTSIARERLRRVAFLVAALFLYVAFFNTLTATTISVIELLAFEQFPQTAKSSRSDPPVDSEMVT